ncbi:MAG TPA: GrdX family protein [Tissierellaceae bacterium]|nr:GrdX family protein [Tissierellaceae bacterium]
MSYQIITNNHNVKKHYDETTFVEGGFEEVLLKVRDLVHSGYELISHPLGASLRMFFSPYRSIIVGDQVIDVDEMHVQIIENSIENYRKHMKERKPDIENKDDYALIDEVLLKASIEEHKKLKIFNNK